MTYASVRSAAEHIARTGAITPHQLAALTRLDEGLTDAQRKQFTDLWRAQGSPAAAVPSTALVSMAQATAVFTRAPSASQLADLNACLSRFQITTPDRIRQFLAQVGHESGGLRWLLELASGDAYEGRSDLGNTRQGDGRRFKGGGAIQLTGRYNYQRFADFIEDQDVMEGAAYVATTYPFTSAGFWWHLNAMNAVVDQGATCRQVSARVNGRDPANGLADREVYYARAVAAFPQSGRPAVELQQPVRSHSNPLQVPWSNPLQVPWYAQMDSADRVQAARMCFSSSCAMLLQYLKPGTLTGPNGDDQYMKRVQTYGDTTNPQAQIRALSSYGIKARFVQSAGWADIEQQIATGIPVPCGFLHRGPVTAPGGGGHWLIVVGFTPTHLIVHDPFGEADLANGTTLGGAARFARYSYKNFGPRWMVEGPGTGWAVLADR
jgi:predicted chitinase